MKTYSMIINGKPVNAAATINVINPATEEVFAMVAAGDTSHVECRRCRRPGRFSGLEQHP
jgi:acyl-CoA reductase-like NAD-dependent aldehyde dehydrogenase